MKRLKFSEIMKMLTELPKLFIKFDFSGIETEEQLINYYKNEKNKFVDSVEEGFGNIDFRCTADDVHLGLDILKLLTYITNIDSEYGFKETNDMVDVLRKVYINVANDLYS